jgi:DNA-binding PadR family transcriptional regulator
MGRRPELVGPLSSSRTPWRLTAARAVQLHVLHHAAEHPIHGAWMAAELARHGYRISPGTLYPTLHRLEAAGLLAGHDDMEAGRRIRRYTITDAGRLALAEARRALRELADELLQ